MSAARSRSPYDEALARFAAGEPTRADVQTIVDGTSMVMLLIHFRAARPPDYGRRVFLLPDDRGPLSAPGKTVVHVSGPRWGGVWAAWWRVTDLRDWLEHEAK